MNGSASPDSEPTEDGATPANGAAEDGEGIILIQDTGFTIQIQSPGAEPFELPVRQH